MTLKEKITMNQMKIKAKKRKITIMELIKQLTINIKTMNIIQ